MTTQCRIRKRAVTIHPERRSKQQHLRHNNIFIYSMGSIFFFCLFCLGFLFTCLLYGSSSSIRMQQQQNQLYQYIFFDVICMYPIRNSCNSRSSRSISQKIGCRYTSYIFFLCYILGCWQILLLTFFFRQLFFIDSTQVVVEQQYYVLLIF